MEEFILEPEIITEENGNQFFHCPACKKIIMMDWDKEEHQVIYPSKCTECEQQLKWTKKLTDLHFKGLDNPQ